jgi:hypothetical protein
MKGFNPRVRGAEEGLQYHRRKEKHEILKRCGVSTTPASRAAGRFDASKGGSTVLMSSSAEPPGTFGRGGISAFSKGPSKEIGSVAERPLPETVAAGAAGAASSSLVSTSPPSKFLNSAASPLSLLVRR